MTECLDDLENETEIPNVEILVVYLHVSFSASEIDLLEEILESKEMKVPVLMKIHALCENSAAEFFEEQHFKSPSAIHQTLNSFFIWVEQQAQICFCLYYLLCPSKTESKTSSVTKNPFKVHIVVNDLIQIQIPFIFRLCCYFSSWFPSNWIWSDLERVHQSLIDEKNSEYTLKMEKLQIELSFIVRNLQSQHRKNNLDQLLDRQNTNDPLSCYEKRWLKQQLLKKNAQFSHFVGQWNQSTTLLLLLSMNDKKPLRERPFGCTLLRLIFDFDVDQKSYMGMIDPINLRKIHQFLLQWTCFTKKNTPTWPFYVFSPTAFRFHQTTKHQTLNTLESYWKCLTVQEASTRTNDSSWFGEPETLYKIERETWQIDPSIFSSFFAFYSFDCSWYGMKQNNRSNCINNKTFQLNFLLFLLKFNIGVQYLQTSEITEITEPNLTLTSPLQTLLISDSNSYSNSNLNFTVSCQTEPNSNKQNKKRKRRESKNKNENRTKKKEVKTALPSQILIECDAYPFISLSAHKVVIESCPLCVPVGDWTNHYLLSRLPPLLSLELDEKEEKFEWKVEIERFVEIPCSTQLGFVFSSSFLQKWIGLLSVKELKSLTNYIVLFTKQNREYDQTTHLAPCYSVLFSNRTIQLSSPNFPHLTEADFLHHNSSLGLNCDHPFSADWKGQKNSWWWQFEPNSKPKPHIQKQSLSTNKTWYLIPFFPFDCQRKGCRGINVSVNVFNTLKAELMFHYLKQQINCDCQLETFAKTSIFDYHYQQIPRFFPKISQVRIQKVWETLDQVLKKQIISECETKSTCLIFFKNPVLSTSWIHSFTEFTF